MNRGWKSEKLRLKEQGTIFWEEEDTMLKEDWGAREEYGIVGEDRSWIERRLLLNEQYAIFIRIQGALSKEQEKQVLDEVRQRVVLPLINGKE